MNILPRTQCGDPILRKKAKNVPVSKIKSGGYTNLIRQMFFTMHKAKGVGLAAPQIGKSLRLAVIEVRANRKDKKIKPLKKTVIINPIILKCSEEKENGWEGCLSLKGIRGKVPRSNIDRC